MDQKQIEVHLFYFLKIMKISFEKKEKTQIKTVLGLNISKAQAMTVHLLLFSQRKAQSVN